MDYIYIHLMFDEYVSYINSHPLIFIIVIVVLLFILYKLYNTTESFSTVSELKNLPTSRGGLNNIGVQNPALPVTTITGTPTTTAETMCKCSLVDPNQQLLGYNGNLVRFKTVINGKNYYLMITPITNCSNLYNPSAATQLENKKQIDNLTGDCTSNVVVLVDEQTALQNVSVYLTNVSDNEKLCNFKQSLVCNKNKANQAQLKQEFSAVSNIVGTTAEQHTCQEQYSFCILPKQTPIDFVVTLANPANLNTCDCGKSMRSYVIAGMAGQFNVDTSSPQFLLNINTNTPITQTSDVAVLCADTTTINNNPNVIVNLLTTEQQVSGQGTNKTEQSNIMGGTVVATLLRTKLQFTVQPTPYTLTPSGASNTKQFYVGACNNNICTTNGKNYARICLFDDILNPNVLEFEPVIVNYSS